MNKKEKIIKFIFLFLLLSPLLLIIYIYLWVFVDDLIPHDFSIEEKLVVRFESDKKIDIEQNYLLDLNTWEYKEYDWDYLKYPCDELDKQENIEYIYYNKDKENFIFCEKENQNYINKIGEKDNKILEIENYTNFSKWYWSNNWKYLIIIEDYPWVKGNAKILWIVDINTWNIRNFFYWNVVSRVFPKDYLEVKEILGYVLNK